MTKYIDAGKLISKIKGIIAAVQTKNHPDALGTMEQCLAAAEIEALNLVLDDIKELQQEQPDNMIQWTGSNLQEVIDFTGKSPKFGVWFKSWDEFESYVHSHGDILKLFSEDGSHFEVPVGAWIVKTPDGHNVPSVARFIHAKQEQLENEEKIMNFFDALGDCGFSQHDILLLKNIWKDAGCQPPKSQVADASKMEHPEVDLDALVNEAFDKYSSIDGYGQLAVSFNRAELYSFIKKITRKEE